MNKETRNLRRNDKIHFRAIEEEGKKFIEGYAAVFEQRSKLIWEGGKEFYEIMERGAFDDILADEALDVIYTFNHRADTIMARTKSGTLQLSADETGLKFRAEMPNTTQANDTYELVKRGDLYENSFIFSLEDKGQSWSRDESGNNLRRINKVNGLFDVSTVNSGAYANTEVAARYCKDFECGINAQKEAIIRATNLENDMDEIAILKLK